MIRIIEQAALDGLSAEAGERARRRLNLNIHDSLDDSVQRFFNALEPGTYVQPHAHEAGTWELFVGLRGTCTVLTFDAEGWVLSRTALGATAAAAVEIPAGTWHMVLATRPGTVAMEIKPGPCRHKNFAAWAPAEGDAGAQAFLAWAETAQPGMRAPAISAA